MKAKSGAYRLNIILPRPIYRLICSVILRDKGIQEMFRLRSAPLNMTEKEILKQTLKHVCL